MRHTLTETWSGLRRNASMTLAVIVTMWVSLTLFGAGLMTAQQVVFDTGVVLAKGSGTIDLETERMDLRIDGDSKKTRLVRLFAPITIKGPLSQPKVGVELGRVAAQGGVAAVLTGLLGPLAALLPFVDPGLEKNADCIALMQEARTAPAPVRITTAITTELPKKK